MGVGPGDALLAMPVAVGSRSGREQKFKNCRYIILILLQGYVYKTQLGILDR